jgi:hypothetical protein
MTRNASITISAELKNYEDCTNQQCLSPNAESSGVAQLFTRGKPPYGNSGGL